LDMKMLLEFDEMMENNLIHETDLTKYDNLSKIQEQLNIAYTKKILKEERSLVDIVFENEEWLAIRPLTFESSKKYGAGTKWCTTSENYPQQFYRYSDIGVLIYLYNKLNNRKFGIHFNMEENKSETQVGIQIYNEVDERIDSSDARIQFEVMDRIKQNIGLEIGERSQTTVTYIKNKYPDIWERYWAEYYDTNEAAIRMINTQIQNIDEVQTIDIPIQEHITYDNDISTVESVSYSESSELIDFVKENIKPKNWFQNLMWKIFSNQIEKLVMIGVPTRRFGFEAIDKIKRMIGDTPGYKLFLYPIYDGSELVITKL